MSFRKPVNAALIQAFGADFQLPDGRWYYKQTLGYNGHNGNDYAAPVGTPVYAADDGTIVFEGWGQNHAWMGAPAGICVLIHHGGSYAGYAHLSSTTVSKGQAVRKGDLIGYVGATGAATGPHLHFELIPLTPNWQNGYAARIDPTPYMDAPATTATPDQIRQAYKEILGRDADDGGLNHYQNYAIDFVRSDLASSQEYRDRQARLEAEARAQAEQAAREAEQQRLAEEQKKAEAIRLEAERKAAEAKAAEDAARAAALAEAERLKREQEAAAQPGKGSVDPAVHDDPFNVPGIIVPAKSDAPTTTTPPVLLPKQNPLARFIFGLILKLITQKK